MKQIVRKYVEFIRQPDVARLLLVALLARMPIGMVGFAMLMFLRESLGNFALAGGVVGMNLIALAAAAPVQGRIIDRLGPRRPLLVTGVVQPLALVGVLVSAAHGAGYWTVAGFAALAGMFASPITTLTRTMWRHRFEREDDRRTAFSLDAIAIEVNFTLGPTIIAALLAWVDARAAFAVAIAVVVASLVIYLGSGVLSLFRKTEVAKRHLLGPLTEPRLWLVFVVTAGLAVCFGLLEVGYPAFATFMLAPALGGLLLAVNSVGSVIGGAIYGGIHFKMPVERQLACTMGLMAIPLCLHALVQTPAIFTVTALVAGGLIAPSIAAQSVLVSRFAPPQYATEAFTWSSTFIVSGIGTGMALGGAMVETVGLRPTFAAGAAIMAAMALFALLVFPPRKARANN
jgi:MFS family permease